MQIWQLLTPEKAISKLSGNTVKIKTNPFSFTYQILLISNFWDINSQNWCWNWISWPQIPQISHRDCPIWCCFKLGTRLRGLLRPRQNSARSSSSASSSDPKFRRKWIKNKSAEFWNCICQKMFEEIVKTNWNNEFKFDLYLWTFWLKIIAEINLETKQNGLHIIENLP